MKKRIKKKKFIVFFKNKNFVVRAKNKKEAIEKAKKLLIKAYGDSIYKKGKAYELNKEYFSSYIV